MGPRILTHKNGPHRDIPGNADRVILLRRHPHRPPRRDDPATALMPLPAADRHHTAQRMDQLGTGVAMGRDMLAMSVIAGQGRDGPGAASQSSWVRILSISRR
jgi:hypothetical protein